MPHLKHSNNRSTSSMVTAPLYCLLLGHKFFFVLFILFYLYLGYIKYQYTELSLDERQFEFWKGIDNLIGTVFFPLQFVSVAQATSVGIYFCFGTKTNLKYLFIFLRNLHHFLILRALFLMQWGGDVSFLCIVVPIS